MKRQCPFLPLLRVANVRGFLRHICHGGQASATAVKRGLCALAPRLVALACDVLSTHWKSGQIERGRSVELDSSVNIGQREIDVERRNVDGGIGVPNHLRPGRKLLVAAASVGPSLDLILGKDEVGRET